jgi:hypothetical protein
MEFDTSLADSAYALAKKWDSARGQAHFPEFSPDDIEGWNSNQVCMLLDTLHEYKSFPHAPVNAVDSIYGVGQTSNPEIKVSGNRPSVANVVRYRRIAVNSDPSASTNPISPAPLAPLRAQSRSAGSRSCRVGQEAR